MPCIKRRGRPFPPQRTPAWTVQKPEFSASRPPQAVPRIVDAARLASFWGTARRETRVIAAPDAVNQPKSPAEGSRWLKRRFRRVCSHPGLLKTPENARRAPGDPCAPRKTRPHPKECERESRMAARAPGSGRNPRRVRPGAAAAARQQKTSCPASMSAPAYANLQLGR